MRFSRNIAAAVVVASMSFAALDAVAQKTLASQAACQSVWVTAPTFGKPASRARRPLNFSAAEVLDLEFQVVVPAGASSAGRPLELKLFTPKAISTRRSPSPRQARVPARGEHGSAVRAIRP
jgi:hypothetical protein